MIRQLLSESRFSIRRNAQQGSKESASQNRFTSALHMHSYYTSESQILQREDVRERVYAQLWRLILLLSVIRLPAAGCRLPFTVYRVSQRGGKLEKA